MTIYPLYFFYSGAERYATDILFQWTIIGWKHFSPHRWAAVVVFFWGFVATIQATTSNWGGLMTCRFFLGVAEAMFGPGVPLYLSYFYPRENVGFRHGIFISGAAMANAYGSALAYGISQIRGSVAPWKILFIIEGVPTCLIAIIAWFFLPDSLLATRFLNEREKAVAAHFVARNQKVEEGSEKSGIRFRELFEAFKDPKSTSSNPTTPTYLKLTPSPGYIPGIMYFSCNVSFASLPLFVPTIISEMGSFSQIQSNGLSAPPYLLCFFTIIILSFLSDRFRMRGPFCAFAALVAAIGFILQATTKSVASRYFGVFLSVNIFASVALLLAWTANLHATESKRAGGYTILATIGQCGPLLGTNVFPASEKPYYHKGMWISCAFCLLVTVLSVALSLHLVRENRKMERAGLLVPQGSETAGAPSNGEFAERKIRYIY